METFNPFKNAVRNEAIDQPRLVSSQNNYEDHAILPQIGFTLENGTEVQVSYERARELGLIATAVIATVRIDEYGKRT